MQKTKQLGSATDNLNRLLNRLLQSFAQNTEWTDINNWLKSLGAVIRDNPSPFINDKLLLSKRLNQCLNPILPHPLHLEVLKIHEAMFINMRASVDNDINQYAKLFAEDLGTYSLTILPYFAHTPINEYRMMIIRLLINYYLDLGYELVPMLMGLFKSFLPVYNQIKDQILLTKMEEFVDLLISKSGRHYVISSIWSCILRFTDCRCAGMKFLARLIPKMDHRKDEEQYESQHGFSAEEQQIRRQQQLQKMGVPVVQQKLIENQEQKYQEIHSNGQLQTTEKFIDRDLISSQAFSKMDLPQYINKNERSTNKFKLKKTSSFDPNDLVISDMNQKPKEFKSDKRQNKNDLQNNDNILGKSQIGEVVLSKVYVEDTQAGSQIKLNKVPIMLTPGIEMIKQIAEQNNNQNNFPSHNTLVLSAVIACLEDASQFVKRASLDFMCSHLRLKATVLNEDDQKILVQSMIRLFRRMEMSVIKRVNRWLLGKQNQNGEYEITSKNQFVIPLVINALRNILSKEPSTQQTCTIPIKIIQNFYMQHNNLASYTIGHISIDVLRYIFNYGSGFSFSEQITKAGKRFFSNIPSHYPLLFTSLSKKLIQGIQKRNSHLAFEAVRYIDFCYIKLMKHDHDVQQLDYITITLQYLTEGLETITKHHKQQESFYTIYMKDLNLLIYNLISRRESVQRFMQKEKEQANKKFLLQSGNLQLPAERLIYQTKLTEQQETQRLRYKQIMQNMQIFLIYLGRLVRSQISVTVYQQIFKLASMSMVKIINHLPQNLQFKQLPKWFTAIQQGIRVSNPTISLAAIDSLIKFLLNSEKHPVYKQFKQFIVKDSNKNTGNDYQSLALQKLWDLLDYPHMHSKIIDLIVAFSKFFPYDFTQTVKKSFNTHSDPQKEASIQRFSHFWRLTGFKYKDLVLSNRQFAELNKVGLFKMLDFLDDRNPLVRNAAKNWMTESLPLFHRVLQPLFLQLMRVGGEWYMTPKGLIVIKQVYNTKSIFNTFRRLRSLLSNGSYSFLRYVYQESIADSLEQLRQKITKINESILADIDLKKIYQQNEKKSEKEPVLPTSLDRAESIVAKKLNYIDLLIILSIKYIQGHAIESMGSEFYMGNSGVNTSAIQLLQSLLNYIENPQICFKFIKFVMEPLCSVLNQAVINQQYITQIQLLNMFKTIFFNSSFRKKGTIQEVRQFFKDLFTNSSFLDSMLNGLKTPFSYVRSQFITFLTSCIELIANFLDPDQCTARIQTILLAYYKIIKQIKISLISDVLESQDKKNQEIRQVEMNKNKGGLQQKNVDKILRLQIKAKQQQKIAKISNNLQQVTKTNQILPVLHGVSAILNYFFDLDKMHPNDMKFSFSNPYTILDSFKSIITLGFASSIKSGRLIEKTQFLHNMETCAAILKDLSPVYETILRSWPLSEQFVRIATQQFTSIGSRVFNFQKFSKYNRVLKDLIDFVSKQKESIWGKIFSIMQPLFYRFPREIMEIYLQIWIRQCTNVGEGKGAPNLEIPLLIEVNISNTQLLMKCVQTIVVSNFPINIIVHAFLQCTLLQEIKNYNGVLKKQGKKTLNLRIAQIQAKLLYFLYTYFSYTFIDEKSLTKENLLDIWSSILKAIKPFTQTNCPTTSLWVVQILSMCSLKYSPKQILSNQKFKTDLHGVVNDQLKFIAGVASKKQIIFYDNPIIVDDHSKNVLDSKFKIILPLAPTLFQMYKSESKLLKQIDSELFKPVKAGDFIQIQRLNRFWCFKILKKLGFELLQSTYLAQKMHFAVIRACQWMQIILPSIEDKASENMEYAESASQVLHNLLEQARLLFIKPLRESIFKIFDKDDFFICNKNTLNYWAQIIDWIVSYDKNNQTFALYLQKVRLENSYFTSQSQENKRRIKSFERICFILYAGGQDKYVFKIKGLLQKIADVIKQAQSSHPALLILILFSIRILIFRLSQISLNQLFIDIWPMLLAFLMQIFSKKLVKVEIANEISKNPNLMLAALKLIEMISISNSGQFAHHQWIFVYDYFGLTISLTEKTVQLGQILSDRPELSNLVTYTRTQSDSPFIYKPYLNNYLPHNSINYLKQEKHEKISCKAQKRKIIVKQSFIKNEDELKVYAYLMAQFLVRLDQYRMQVDPSDVESVIINDFIKLDSFIFKI